MKPIFIFFLLSVFCSSLSAQDKIVKTNNTIIKCRIKEVGTEEIKYLLWDDLSGPIFAISRDQVKSIAFENGKKDFPSNASDPLKDPENYIGQRSRALKFDFIGPLLGYTQISYEKNTGVGKSYELSLGIIGLGKSSTIEYSYSGAGFQETKKNPFGLFVGAGYKLNKLPDFIFGRTRFTHLMQGAYAKPMVYLGTYNENQLVWKGGNQYVIDRPNVVFGALQVELGKQWVFGNAMLIDWYWGFGYGFDNKKVNSQFLYDEDASAFNYANSRIGKSPSLSFSFGLRLGLLLKEKQNKN
jgi:hypothetical protein